MHLIINFILRHSCAKTLARKYNLKSRAKVFKKYGYHLVTKNEPIMKFYTESDFKWKPTWDQNLRLVFPFEVLN